MNGSKENAASNKLFILGGGNSQSSGLKPALRLACIVPLLAALIAIPTAMKTENWLFVILFGVLSIWSLISAFMPRIPSKMQSNGLLLALFLTGLGELLAQNSLTDTKVVFTGLVIAAILFGGIRTGILAAFTSVFTVSITTGLMLAVQSAGPVSDYPQQVNAWIVSSFSFALLLVFVTGMLAYFSNSQKTELKKGLIDQNEFADKVRELDNALQQSNKSLMRSERGFDSSDLFSRQFLTDDSPENTLLKAVQFIKDEFGYSFVGAYLVDDKNENAIIRTSAGLPEGLKLDDDQRIKLSDPSNISYAITHAEVRLISNVHDERFTGADLLLPDTQAELILPLAYQNRILGAIDIQSNHTNAFSPIELKVLRTYLSQIVIAYQRATLAEELKKKEDDLNAILRQYTQQTWHNHLKQGKRKFSIRYRHNILEKEVPQSVETNKVINLGETVIIPNQPTSFSGKPSTSIAVPIRLRDQVIGVLNLKVEASQLPRDMMPLVESISNRMALALLEEIQARADREHLVSEISNRIRSSPNVEQVLRTAVSEIGLSLGASEVMIKLHSDQ